MIKKNIPLIIHTLILTLLITAGLGFQWAENLVSATLFIVSICMMYTATQLTSKEFIEVNKGNKRKFSLVTVAFMLEVVLSFAFGWFVIGSLLAFGWFVIGSLLAFGLMLVACRKIQLKEECRHASTDR